MSNTAATPQSGAPGQQVQQRTKLDHFLSVIITEDRRRQIESSLPRHINFDRFERNLMNAVMANPELMTADPSLLWREISKSVQLGILLDPELGEGYLMMVWNGKTRRKEPQYRSGWRGLVKLARQSGEVLNIFPREVHEKDPIEADLANNTLTHKPKLFSDRGPVIGYYAVVKYKNGEMDFEPMDRAAVERIRDVKSDGYRAFKDEKIKSTPWDSDFDEMAKKTVIRRLCKRIPKSPELQNALSYEDAVDYGGAPMRDITPQTERPKLADYAKPAVTHQPTTEPAEPSSDAAEPDADPFFFTDAFGTKSDEPLGDGEFYGMIVDGLDQCSSGAAMEALLGHNQDGTDRLNETAKDLLQASLEQNNRRLRDLAVKAEQEAQKQAATEKAAAKPAEAAPAAPAAEPAPPAPPAAAPAAAPQESESPAPPAEAPSLVIPLEHGTSGVPLEKRYYSAFKAAFKGAGNPDEVRAVWAANKAGLAELSNYWRGQVETAAKERIAEMEKAT
jgi:recombination protein RecT